MKVCESATFFPVKGIRKGYLFCQNGTQKSKGLDLGLEPPRIELYRVARRSSPSIPCPYSKSCQ